jgi:uroporphyrin-III C-methyltransferase
VTEADPPNPEPVVPARAPAPESAPAAAPASISGPGPGLGRWVAVAAVLLAGLAGAALVFAWNTQQRVKALEVELVKRQQDSGSQATEARTLARQAEAVAREVAGRVALLDARVAETSLQRTQFEDLVQSLARSRDENVLADIDAALRVALQQTAITGSVEPLVVALRQADERLARYNQPRLERVRRAVTQDLDRVRAAGGSDIGVLTVRLDELIRQVDELPMLAQGERRPGRASAHAAIASAAEPAKPASAAASTALAASAAEPGNHWSSVVGQRGQDLLIQVWREIKGLVRVTRIDTPEAMLVAPDQAWFLRENLKLRLLNARLALLSRQFDTAQLDLRDAQTALDRYFDRNARRVQQSSEQLKQVAAEARAVTVPRPDATLAAIATAAAGR